MAGKLICIIGPDGTGKTTQANLLVEHLRNQGVNCDYEWLRIHHFFSLPVLACARLMGLSSVETLESGRRIGYHHFERSKTISFLYLVFLWLDTLMFTGLKAHIPVKIFNKQIVCDRFVYDTLVDLSLSTNNEQIFSNVVGKCFMSLVPSNTTALMLIAKEEVLMSRRDDIYHDKLIKRKIATYRKIAVQYGIPTIDSNQDIKKVQIDILKEVYG